MNNHELGYLQHFLLTRIADDLSHHNPVPDPTSPFSGPSGCVEDGIPEYGSCLVQRDAEAKTRFIRQHEPDADTAQPEATEVYTQALRLMANSYFDHPDYEKEWAI